MDFNILTGTVKVQLTVTVGTRDVIDSRNIIHMYNNVISLWILDKKWSINWTYSVTPETSI